MKVYIQSTKEHSMFEQAAIGFYKLGYEVIRYDLTPTTIEQDAILVGGIESMGIFCYALGFKQPEQINYPTDLQDFMYRKVEIKKTTELPDVYPYFIKPVGLKSASGRVVSQFSDRIGITSPEVYYTSTVLKLKSEYRIYVLKGEIIGVKHYKGDPFIYLDRDTIKSMIHYYTSSPNAYSLDIGVLYDGTHVLIEVNHAYSSGNYGMNEITYAKFLRQGYLDIVKQSVSEDKYGTCPVDDFPLNIVGVCTNPHCDTNIF